MLVTLKTQTARPKSERYSSSNLKLFIVIISGHELPKANNGLTCPSFIYPPMSEAARQECFAMGYLRKQE
ncbi:hypothetical protein ACLK1S_21865 [Escherichia coli]